MTMTMMMMTMIMMMMTMIQHIQNYMQHTYFRAHIANDISFTWLRQCSCQSIQGYGPEKQQDKHHQKIKNTRRKPRKLPVEARAMALLHAVKRKAKKHNLELCHRQVKLQKDIEGMVTMSQQCNEI